MNPQDKSAVRTPLDIERKYNLKGMQKAIEMQKNNLYKLDANLVNFVNSVTKDLGDLQNQVDGNITTWFSNGEPTLKTFPSSEWPLEEYDTHLGDLYYDSGTGYSYRFAIIDGIYKWIKLTDSDITKALAMAQNAKDTADSKRRIFLDEPTVPYDNGDMWIKDEEIYICQVSKDINQLFDENDFIIATKYTDDTFANQVNGKVTVLSGQVTTIEQNVDKITAELEDSKYYVDEEGNKIPITKQVNKLTATVYGLNEMTSSIGGNNVFRNTGLWFSEETGTGYEFWEGKVVRKSNDEAANNNSMLLQNGLLRQEQEVPNGNYSISFYYKKLIEQAKASVLINDIEYPLDSLKTKQFYTGETDNETGEYITQPIIVTSNHIKIEFKSDANNAVEVWDLMCNKGTVKLAYSQNANETTTETVNISKGITITSTNMETIFRANANGIKILTLQGATIAYFTDKGLSTNELIVNNKAQVCGALISQVGEQTWFTRM